MVLSAPLRSIVTASVPSSRNRLPRRVKVCKFPPGCPAGPAPSASPRPRAAPPASPGGPPRPRERTPAARRTPPAPPAPRRPGTPRGRPGDAQQAPLHRAGLQQGPLHRDLHRRRGPRPVEAQAHRRPRLTAHQLHQPGGGQTGRVRPVHRQHGVPGPDSRLLRRPPFRHLHHQRPGGAGLEGGRIGDAGPHAPVALRPVQRPHLPLVARGQGGVAVPQAARHGPVRRPRQGPGVGPRALRQCPEAGPEVGPGRPSIGGERPGGISPGDLAGRFEGPRPARAQQRRRLQGGGVAPQEQPQLGLHGAQGALDGWRRGAAAGACAGATVCAGAGQPPGPAEPSSDPRARIRAASHRRSDRPAQSHPPILTG